MKTEQVGELYYSKSWAVLILAQDDMNQLGLGWMSYIIQSIVQYYPKGTSWIVKSSVILIKTLSWISTFPSSSAVLWAELM